MPRAKGTRARTLPPESLTKRVDDPLTPRERAYLRACRADPAMPDGDRISLAVYTDPETGRRGPGGRMYGATGDDADGRVLLVCPGDPDGPGGAVARLALAWLTYGPRLLAQAERHGGRCEARAGG